MKCLLALLIFESAAERLHLSPQALSHAVAGLEAHYGQKLVLRDRKYHGLTAAGEALLAEAPGVLAGLERMDLALRQATATGPQGPLRVGGPGYVVTHLLPAALAALVQAHPALTALYLAQTTASSWQNWTAL